MKALYRPDSILTIGTQQLDQDTGLFSFFRNRTSKIGELGNLIHHQRSSQNSSHHWLIAFHVPGAKSKSGGMALKLAVLVIPLTSKLKLLENAHLGCLNAGGLSDRFPSLILVQAFTAISTLVEGASEARELAQRCCLP